jgi:hypothetical protein
VFVYAGDPAAPKSLPVIDPPDGGARAFGASIAGIGDYDNDGYSDVVIGAPDFSSTIPLTSSCGKVYLYHGTASGLAPFGNFTTFTDRSRLGIAVAGAGDFDGDGFFDFVAGASEYPQRAGQLFMFRGSAALVSSYAKGLGGTYAYGHYGEWTASLSDLRRRSPSGLRPQRRNMVRRSLALLP